ncbi:MAG: trypsin-like peptidase domain-containing protein [Thermoguttaceae bacterium]|nr:trypsin-like peptidase domain-containing protein [Thermoguttaceae bacterium]
MFTLCFLLGLLLIPSLAERIVYSVVRGVERAKREEALKFLAEVPEANSRIPWIVKAVGPSVVGISMGRSSGTGIIIDPRGYVLTNRHVVVGDRGMNLQHMEVRLSDGRLQSGGVELVGADPVNDLAVLKITLLDLPSITWGDSQSVEVGETVIAIGNPSGLDHSVSMGIISAKDRRDKKGEDGSAQVYIQTDAAINPGNSGGPLVDQHGKVIGINTAIIGESYQGISFAIPADLAQKISQKIIEESRSQEH